MRVYIVKQDNGEEYEDYADFIAGVYTSEEKALDAIRRSGFAGKHRYGSRFYWTRTVDDCGYDMTESAWIEEYEVQE